MRPSSVIKPALTCAIVAAASLASASAAEAVPPSTWNAIVECESGGRWDTNTGNGFYGGPQFALATWREYGGTGMPQNASRRQQIAVAERVLAGQGWGAWPACSRKLGLR